MFLDSSSKRLFTHSKHGGLDVSQTLEPEIKMAAALPVFALNKNGDNTSRSRFSPSIKMVLVTQVP